VGTLHGAPEPTSSGGSQTFVVALQSRSSAQGAQGAALQDSPDFGFAMQRPM
jgi:hypothetical protein